MRVRKADSDAIITDMQSIPSKELEKARAELLGRSASVSEKTYTRRSILVYY